eukprot:3744229-Prymnesium_polylepis.1
MQSSWGFAVDWEPRLPCHPRSSDAKQPGSQAKQPAMGTASSPTKRKADPDENSCDMIAATSHSFMTDCSLYT